MVIKYLSIDAQQTSSATSQCILWCANYYSINWFEIGFCLSMRHLCWLLYFLWWYRSFIGQSVTLQRNVSWTRRGNSSLVLDAIFKNGNIGLTGFTKYMSIQFFLRVASQIAIFIPSIFMLPYPIGLVPIIFNLKLYDRILIPTYYLHYAIRRKLQSNS